MPYSKSTQVKFGDALTGWVVRFRASKHILDPFSRASAGLISILRLRMILDTARRTSLVGIIRIRQVLNIELTLQAKTLPQFPHQSPICSHEDW